MNPGLSLRQYLDDHAGTDPLRQAVIEVVAALAQASTEISDLIRSGALAGITGQVQGRNADGDIQKDLDLRADRIIRAALEPLPIAAIASEEAMESKILYPAAPISIAVDPLDGSSNIDTNMSVGTIFSVLPTPRDIRATFTQPGASQLAAGFFVYGPQTSLVLTLGRGVDIFTLDRGANLFKLIRSAVQIPADTAEFAINASNQRHWEPPVQAFIEDCMAGASGERGKDFNMRWIGSLVAEAYRILTRGGVFLYPADAREGYGEGRLRLVYEANPMAFIMEQAGGEASTGRQRILDLAPGALHQRVPLIMGSRDKVRRLERLHMSPDIKSEKNAPLFAHRGLFRN
ncbi:class 1 fructose-bisphosphatase [Bradyrhizobium sediminis]|uniref:Fructose-1,6-bisphosphatase class 1 n=1 Tax=Bradyrhizobium sediminis TaxID=2840469 RepID=A0A975RPA0_9BRAD|nr:class 1 fructose-bisphosphatase [Bradyrhizobium sediminis]QWG14578.1 class 1 fructose-bisphosphatase [Bradyrhizobium sediminis]